ncbi:VOC family protein [Brachybacterium huguangmaarense]|uniref:VOC family protein n=1 Tax=Brachybacterium huguangmaarense TaxID=1652028 RepID=A0ABY6G3B6_9MICO|nr:VOC family protein [Brachybacterium huguangmaarense]UYG17454.1 VOC family protein [Brachybacterium huguangmaarense]
MNHTDTIAPRPLGAPTWMDLSCHDLESAQSFYGDLFGWTFEDAGPETHHYQRASVDGRPVAGLMLAMDADGTPLPADEAPSAWTVYLATDDVERTSAAIADAGGSLVFGPVDVPDVGRMAFVADAVGTPFGIWQAAPFAGFDTAGGAGAPVWFECMSGDALVAEQFYRDALGWQIAVMRGSSGSGFWYATNGEGQAATAGLCDASAFLPAGAPGFWRLYLEVEDTDATVARVVELGGRVLDGPQDSPFGYLATVADPEGASFQVIQSSRRSA